MTYYIFDTRNHTFHVTGTLRVYLNPTKLRYSQLPDACWTSLEDCQKAVVGVLLAAADYMDQASDSHRAKAALLMQEHAVCVECQGVYAAVDLNDENICYECISNRSES